MIRTQVYLPDEVHTKLNYLATARKEPMARIVREYVEDGLHRDQTKLKGNAHFLLELAELAEKEGWSGPGDLAKNHNVYFAEALEKDLERIYKQHENTR